MTSKRKSSGLAQPELFMFLKTIILITIIIQYILLYVKFNFLITFIKNDEAKLVIPLKLDIEDEVRKTAIKAFKAVDGKGLSRVDFFVTDDNEIYINEINTMPGFTNISMYSKLWNESGINYSDLIDKLIDLAFEE